MLVHQGGVRSVLLRAVLLSRWRRVRYYPLRGVPPAHPGDAVEEAFPGVGGKATMGRTVPINMMYNHQVRCDCVDIPSSGESKVGDKHDISVSQLNSRIFDN